MLTASCHCGAVRIEVEAAPEYLNQCGCSVCRRYGVLWGYYQVDRVRLGFGPEATEVYTWGPGELEFHRCRGCGCVSHWRSVDRSYTRIGINGRLFEPGDVEGVEVRRTPGPP